MSDETYMRAALNEAAKAEELGEVPVGAVIVKDGAIIGRGFNLNLANNDPSAHAEIIALRNAGGVLGNHRMSDCDMFVTIEPCAMCAGALIQARLKRLVFGAVDTKAGAVQSVIQVLNHPQLNHQMDVVSGVLANECSEVIQKFFRKKRERTQ
jgi:tRNA(adenine34) deaminase